MEKIGSQTIAAGALTAGGVNNVDFTVRAAFSRWSVHVVPVHAGGGAPTMNVEVLYQVAGTFRSTNPAGAAAAVLNKDNVITREDVVGRIRVALTNSDPAADGGCVVELWGQR